MWFKIFLKWVSIPLIIFSVGYIGTIYFENNNNWFTKLFTIKDKDIDSLTNTIWSVQAGIISLSIALLALVLGPSREKKFGINILEFYFIKKRKLYTGYEVIFGLLFMIFFNYFFVINNYLFGTLLNFSICLLGVFDILRTIFKFLRADEGVKRDIRHFLRDECKKIIEKENKDA